MVLSLLIFCFNWAYWPFCCCHCRRTINMDPWPLWFWIWNTWFGYRKLKLKPSSSSPSDRDYFRTIRWMQENASVVAAAELTLQSSLCLPGIFPGCSWFFLVMDTSIVCTGLRVPCQTYSVVLPWEAVKYRRQCMGGKAKVFYTFSKMK